jgi:hypothetical protein
LDQCRFKASGNLEFVFPGTHHAGHGGEYGYWPLDTLAEISFYENNDFGSYKSYHIIGRPSDFYGGFCMTTTWDLAVIHPIMKSSVKNMDSVIVAGRNKMGKSSGRQRRPQC